MLHNKYFDIIKRFLENYNSELYGRGLVGKVSLSQKGTAIALDDLEKEGLLKSRLEGNIKYFRLNTDNSELKEVLAIAETMRKIEFLKKYRKLANIFTNEDRIVGVFGSYAKNTQRKESDIDIFIIGKKLDNDYDKKGKTYDLNISIKYFSETDFKRLLKEKNNLCKEIVKDHILIFGIEKFISIIWRYYYGFN